MAIYFVQHGLAVAKEQDPERPLSVEGQESIMDMATYLHKLSVTPSKICHSGKSRAEQTAQILADYIGDGSVYELTGMSPNDNAIAFASALKDDDTMYIGHLPHIDKLVSYLITGDENFGVVKFTNGSVVCLGKNEAGFYVDWLMQPTMCWT